MTKIEIILASKLGSHVERIFQKPHATVPLKTFAANSFDKVDSHEDVHDFHVLDQNKDVIVLHYLFVQHRKDHNSLTWVYTGTVYWVENTSGQYGFGPVYRPLP